MASSDFHSTDFKLEYIPKEELKPSQVLSYKDIFNAHDLDGDGQITATEFKEVFEAMFGVGGEPEQYQALITAIDLDHSDSVDFNECLAYYLTRSDSSLEKRHKLKKALDLYDFEHNSTIPVEELKQTLTKLGHSVDDAELSSGPVSTEAFAAIILRA